MIVMCLCLLIRHRYIVLGSGLLSLIGSTVIILSTVRFRELSKRFFAIRLIFDFIFINLFEISFSLIRSSFTWSSVLLILFT